MEINTGNVIIISKIYSKFLFIFLKSSVFIFEKYGKNKTFNGDTEDCKVLTRTISTPILAIVAVGKPACTDRLSGIKNKVATKTPLNIRVPP